jgi:outer membrane lipoprotein-sorting protein
VSGASERPIPSGWDDFKAKNMRRHRVATILHLTVACLAVGLGASARAHAAAPSASSLDSVYARIDEASRKFHGMSADMRKLAHQHVINEDTVDEGSLKVLRRKHDILVLIQFTKPAERRIALHDKQAEIFYPNANRVEVYDAGKYRSLMDQFMLLGFGTPSAELKRAYDVTGGVPDTVAGQKTTKIELVPRSPDMLKDLKKVELWISEETGISVQQKFYTGGGNYYLATYTNMKLEANMPESALKLNAPKNAKREFPQR